MTYSLAAHASRRDSLVGLVAAEVILAVSALVGTDDLQVDTLVGDLVVLAAAWILGDGARRRREDALSEQQRLAREAVAEERLRIARELHDVVAHSMSVIAVQAGTGRLVLDDEPDHARRALASIEATSKEALGEMRRAPGGPAGRRPGGRHPRARAHSPRPRPPRRFPGGGGHAGRRPGRR